MVIIHPTELTRAQWLEKRKQGIGGSDAAAVLGLNPWMDNITLWEIKTGRREQEDISAKDYVRYGVEIEQYLRAIYAMDHPEIEMHYRENDIRVSEKYPFMFVSLDGWTVDKNTGELRVFEAKHTNILNSMSREKWNDSIPTNYFIQLLHGLNVLPDFTGSDLFADLKSIWQNQPRHALRPYNIERADFKDDLEILMEKVIHFWEYNVQRDIKPNLILPQI